ncbi:MAG: putative PEP-binding protein [bacterium]
MPEPNLRLFLTDFNLIFADIQPSEIRTLARAFKISQDKIKEIIEKLHESNPDLGTLGVRQTLTLSPALYQVQIEAICQAMIQKPASKSAAIMVPFIVDHKEFQIIVQMIEEIAGRNNLIRRGDYYIDAIIETPRAALDAGNIAPLADSIVFDTHGLTEFVLALTYKDAQRFLPRFIEKGIYKKDPFDEVPESVKRFISIAMRRILDTGFNKNGCYFMGHENLDMKLLAPFQVAAQKEVAGQDSVRAIDEAQ